MHENIGANNGKELLWLSTESSSGFVSCSHIFAWLFDSSPNYYLKMFA